MPALQAQRRASWYMSLWQVERGDVALDACSPPNAQAKEVEGSPKLLS